MIIKCKMCGGDIEATLDMTVGKCRYCGSTMTLPRIESDKKARLFNKANEYRLNNEFDKAYDAYKSIVEEDEQEAEAYWGMILSEYGIEYVEDEKTHQRVATCHRTHVNNIQSTTNYELAIKYADAERRFMYQDEAEELDKLQRSILAVSSKEEDYDVFICYKESEDDGERTKDSVLAQEIYTELEKTGIRAFFARISLEDHLGENYEPYIYAALTSAKVMLLVSTSGEHCDSVWVKNEWKRFLGFMEDHPEKSIVPVFQGMSPYEFPSELSKFQAQDMSKVGAVQDLVRGVQKLLGKTAREATNQVLTELSLKQKERDEREAKRKKRLKKVGRILATVAVVAAAVALIVVFVVMPRIEIKEKYNQAVMYYENGKYEEAINILDGLDGYGDSEAIISDGNQKIAELQERVNSEAYDAAVDFFEAGQISKAEKSFYKIIDYKDSYTYYLKCAYYLISRDIKDEKYEGALENAERESQVVKDDKDQEQINELLYTAANDLMTMGEYELAQKYYKIMTLSNYLDSSDKQELAIQYDEQSKQAMKEISGFYKSTSKELYFKINEARTVYWANSIEEIAGNTIVGGWRFFYDASADKYRFVTKDTEFNVIYENEELTISGHAKSDYMGQDGLPGSYEKTSILD